MASPMEAFNASQTSLPDTIYATISPIQTGFVSKVVENTSVSGVILTLLALAITYDQGM
jgi:hypothetical protein